MACDHSIIRIICIVVTISDRCIPSGRDKTFVDRFGSRGVNVINYELQSVPMRIIISQEETNLERFTELRPSCRSIPLYMFNARKENTRRGERRERGTICCDKSDTVFARLVCIETTGIQQTFNEPLFAVLYEINYSTPNEYKLLFNKAILTSSLEYRGRV